MGRWHLFELIDQSFCPAAVRDGVTAYLRYVESKLDIFGPVAPVLGSALRRAGTDQIVDLGSGSGGPWPRLGRLVEVEAGRPVMVTLTDLYPDSLAVSGLGRGPDWGNGTVKAHLEPVDAGAVPSQLEGVRTLFALLHHFRPDRARAVLADAANNGQGIAVFEMTHRSVGAIAVMCLALVTVPMLMARVRPMRSSHLIFTYAVPLIPLATCLDGVVSCLRTYSVDELEELSAGLGPEGYEWRCGTVKGSPWSPAPVTYLIGCPGRPDSTERDPEVAE